MTMRDIGRLGVATFLLAALAYHAAPQLAHVLRSTDRQDQVTINGAVRAVNLFAPEPDMTLEDSDGHQWHVLLGSQLQISHSGLSAVPPQAGEAAQVVGVMSGGETIRAARLMVEGQEYDIPAPGPGRT